MDGGGPVKGQIHPFILISLVMSLSGAVIGLNRVSIWFAPVILGIAIAGMSSVAVSTRREERRRRGAAGAIDYSRLMATPVAQFIPWLKDNVRGHDRVIDAVMAELERNLRLAKPGRHLGAFLLVGPTGTGKTFLAQLLGQALFPNVEPVILRMNQYKHPDDVYTLIGPPPGMPGYEVGGTLTRPVLEHPYRLVLMDELEKCHADIHHCLYDILDTARCREKSSGRTVDFSGCVFFGTSNSGVEALRALREPQGSGSTAPDAARWLGRSRDALAEAAGFDKAFLARWSGVQFMDELPPLHVAEVACLQLAKHWREYGIEVAYTAPEIILRAVERNEEFRAYGVRQLASYLQTATADAILQARQTGAQQVTLGVSSDGALTVAQRRDKSH